MKIWLSELTFTDEDVDDIDRRRTIKIGLFLPNWVGDVVMATPTLRTLREYYGNHHQLIGIMRPYVAEVLSGTNWLDDVILYDRRSGGKTMRGLSLIRQLRNRQLDSVLLFTNSLRSAVIARLSKIPQRVGYVRYGRGSLLTEKLEPPRSGIRLSPISALDYYLNLAQAVGASIDSRHTELATTTKNDDQAAAIATRFGFRDSRPMIALNTGGAYGSAKQWPVEYFATLAQRLVHELEANIIVLCGPSETGSASRIEELANSDRVRTLANESVSIGLSKAMVKRARLLISTDSGPRHFGAAFDVPTITLFGPTDPRWSENYQEHAIHLSRDVPCGPCAHRKCPVAHHRCMRELTVDQVFHATVNLLKTTRPIRYVA